MLRGKNCNNSSASKTYTNILESDELFQYFYKFLNDVIMSNVKVKIIWFDYKLTKCRRYNYKIFKGFGILHILTLFLFLYK